MPSKRPEDAPSREITDEKHYLSRRNFLRAGTIGASVLGTAGLYRALTSTGGRATPDLPPADAPSAYPRTFDAQGEVATDLESITNYNNFYEFTTGKEGVAS